MTAKAIFVGGNIITMKNQDEVHSAISICEDRIVSLGTDQELLSTKKPEDTIINLQGKTVLPGFFDSHVHLMSTLLNESSLNLMDCKSIKDVLTSIGDYAKLHPNIKLLYCSGLSEFNLIEKRMPTRSELDSVCHRIPILISSLEFHTVILNTLAMHRFNIPFTTNSMTKDIKNSFTGIVRDRGSIIARRKMYEIFNENDYFAGLDNVIYKTLSKGVTSITSIEGGSLFHDKHVKILKDNMDRFPFTIDLFYSTTDAYKVTKLGIDKIGGDIFLDGSFRSHNAAIYEDYKDLPNHNGTLYFSRDELLEFMNAANSRGMQLSVHAVGTRAIELLLECYEYIIDVTLENPNPFRHRIEHFELPNDEQIERASRLGLILCMHPNYEYYFKDSGDMYDIRLGNELSNKTNPLRKILDSGAMIIGGSDSDVMPIDPLLGIQSAVTHPNPESRISVFEAMQMYTSNPAYSSFNEHTLGTLESGKIADMIVLDKNPLTTNKYAIKDISILATIKDGVFVYSRDRWCDL